MPNLSEATDRNLVDKLLKGRTMSVYALLLSSGKMGVRDIQRTLGFSSPSLALHHLTKLSELDLVEKDIDGIYSVKRTVRVGSLSLFIKFSFFVLVFLSVAIPSVANLVGDSLLWLAVLFGDMGASLLVILNAMRVGRKKYTKLKHQQKSNLINTSAQNT